MIHFKQCPLKIRTLAVLAMDIVFDPLANEVERGKRRECCTSELYPCYHSLSDNGSQLTDDDFQR